MIFFLASGTKIRLNFECNRTYSHRMSTNDGDRSTNENYEWHTKYETVRHENGMESNRGVQIAVCIGQETHSAPTESTASFLIL